MTFIDSALWILNVCVGYILKDLCRCHMALHILHFSKAYIHNVKTHAA